MLVGRLHVQMHERFEVLLREGLRYHEQKCGCLSVPCGAYDAEKPMHTHLRLKRNVMPGKTPRLHVHAKR